MSHAFPQTLIEAVQHKVAECPNAAAFFEQTSTGFVPHTHQDLHDAMSGMAQTLKTLGVSNGDGIGVLGRPSYRWEVSDKAILCAGGITVGLDHKSAPSDLGHMVDHAGLKGIFAEDESFLELLPEAHRATLDFVILFHGSANSSDATTMGFDEAVQGGGDPADLPEVHPDDVAVIIFTSGTTGPPKGIPLTHRKLTASLPQMRQTFSDLLGADHRTLLAWLPLHNGTGRMMSSINYYLGGGAVLRRRPPHLVRPHEGRSPHLRGDGSPNPGEGPGAGAVWPRGPAVPEALVVPYHVGGARTQPSGLADNRDRTPWHRTCS